MKRGRKLGSTGYYCVKLSDLNTKLSPDFLVPIRTSLAKQLFPDHMILVKPPEIQEKPLTKSEENSKVSFTVINPEE